MATTANNGADFALDMQDSIKRVIEKKAAKIVEEEIETAKAIIELRLRDELANIVLAVHGFYQCTMRGHELIITMQHTPKE